MSRPLWKRAVAAALALWLAVGLSVTWALRPCAAHGALVTHAGGTQGNPSHHHHPASGHERGAPQPEPQKPACTCLAYCGHSSLPALLGGRDDGARHLAQSARPPALPVEHWLPAATAYLLPFANGPPHAVSA